MEDKFCRVCLLNLPINSVGSLLNYSQDPDTFVMLKGIFSVCSIQIFNDDETRLDICPECQQQLEIALSFFQRCKKSDAILRNTLTIKKENEVTLDGDGDGDSYNVEIDVDVAVESDEDDPDDVPLSKLSDILKTADNQEKEPKQRGYVCSECGKSFRYALSLQNHQIKHTGDPPHHCITCDERFASFKQIKKHMQLEHNGLTYSPYACSHCSETFPSKYLTEKHEHVVHQIGRNFSCVSCEKTFVTEASLKDHENSHSGARPYCCLVCSKAFTTSAVLREHVTNIHKGLKKFVCQCGRSFDRRKKLDIHVEVVHEKTCRLKKHQCPECRKMFQHPYALKAHMNIHLGLKPFLCSACACSFTSQSNLTNHYRRVHASGDKPPEKIHLCSQCGQSFSRVSHLKRHILRKHTTSPDKNYECPLCQKKFLEKYDVAHHMKSHSDEKPFICEKCSKCFRTCGNLSGHVARVHLGLRPFECPTCGIRFKTKSHLEKHIRTHTGEKPFHCPHCSYCCAERSNLNKHINIHLKSR